MRTLAFTRNFSSSKSVFKDKISEKLTIKLFEDIPGPRGPFNLGNLYNYFPIFGKYSWLELHKASQDKYNKYGSIVRETMVPGTHIVWIYDPKDIAILLSERGYPKRRSHLALEKYRKDRPHIYRSSGLLPTNGTEWWRIRSEFQKPIGAPKNVRSFLRDVDNVVCEFVDYLESNTTFNILPDLSRLNLELTCLLTFNERMNAFDPKELLPKSKTSRLIWATEETNKNILPTDQGFQLWRYFETRTYKRIKKAQEYMESVAIELISRKKFPLKDFERKEGNKSHMLRNSLVEEYLMNPKLDLSDVIGMSMDLMLAGVDTTSYTLSFALYHISRNQDVQQKIFQESISVLECVDHQLSSDDIENRMTYTRAVLKEVFRLNPISIGVGRILNEDMILGGYTVPAGTVVVTQNMIACRLDKHFSDPLKFYPERWIERKRYFNPYLVLPFGHGMRSCIARRLAEQNMLVFLLRLIRKYKVSWRGKDNIDVHTLLINKPSEPVNILLEKRNVE